MAQASAEYERAIALAPGNALVLREYGPSVVSLGRVDAGIAAGRRAVVLDPLNALTHRRLGQSFYYAHRYQEAIAALSVGRTGSRAQRCEYLWKAWARLLHAR
jgi:hypothetical protein